MVGTRGVGRLAAMVLALAVVLLLVLADAARAGTYRVAQCGWGIGAELDPSMPRAEGPAAYLHPGWCTAPPAGVPAGLRFEDGLATSGEQGVVRARWAAPPGTNFASVHFTWSSEMAAGVWQVAGIDDGTEFHALAAAGASKPPIGVTQGVTGPAPAFEVRLECLLLGPLVGCDRSVSSSLTLSGVILTVDDPVPPKAQLGGALVAPGWHRGTVAFELGAEDAVGSGVAREEAAIDGATVGAIPSACTVATIEGEALATRLRPCPASASGAFEVDTTRLGDGLHTLHGCAADLGGGIGCGPDARIAVDNSPPEVEFAAAPEGQVAATVSDAFSGPASGTISMRRAEESTWTDLPTSFVRGGSGAATLSAHLPDLSGGAYFFRAMAADAAGNGGSAQFRAAGTAESLRRQIAGADGSGRGPAPRGGRGAAGARGRAAHLVANLVEGSAGARGDRPAAPTATWALAALADRGRRRPGSPGVPLTVDFGAAVELRGRLTDAHGEGIADRPVRVSAHPAGGSGAAPSHRRVVTDGAGRFRLRLPAGTSRRVSVSFGGGGGFGSARGRPLSLRVRAAVSLAVTPLRLRTGESVELRGRVRPGAARIPARGKLVTIQYLEQASGRWRPALVARTDARGRFKLRYRFRYVTGEARIRLRATALPEARWPYAEGSSAPVTVEVRG